MAPVKPRKAPYKRSTVTPKERLRRKDRHCGSERTVARAQPFRAHSGQSAAISSARWPQRSHFERKVATVRPFRAHSGPLRQPFREHSGHSTAISSAQWPQRSQFERTVATAQPFRAHSSQSTAGAVFWRPRRADSGLPGFESTAEPTM